MRWGDRDSYGDIITWGYVSEEEKLTLISRATALVFPSIREGWGIPITEAANVGTPSIVYDSPGIRDAVDFGSAGYLCKENNLNEICRLMKCTINDVKKYEETKEKAYDFSKVLVWSEVGKKFEEAIERIEHGLK